ncbi:MAG TPA: hypothetical protein VK685_09835, partial [Candidatus Acidoferrum sp.]|nr:hypothetical protein [Candidatus Acidoferrum sp.]
MFSDHDNPASTTAGGAAAAAAPEAENAAKDANRQQHSAGAETQEQKKELNQGPLDSGSADAHGDTPQHGSSSDGSSQSGGRAENPTAVPQADGDSQSLVNTSGGSAAQGVHRGSGSHG